MNRRSRVYLRRNDVLNARRRQSYRRSDFSWTCLTLSFQTEINATHQRSVQESFGSKIVRVSEETRKLPVALEFREPTQRWKMPRYYGFRKNRKQLKH